MQPSSKVIPWPTVVSRTLSRNALRISTISFLKNFSHSHVSVLYPVTNIVFFWGPTFLMGWERKWENEWGKERRRRKKTSVHNLRPVRLSWLFQTLLPSSEELLLSNTIRSKHFRIKSCRGQNRLSLGNFTYLNVLSFNIKF